jgi:hypothetical protein
MDAGVRWFDLAPEVRAADRRRFGWRVFFTSCLITVSVGVGAVVALVAKQAFAHPAQLTNGGIIIGGLVVVSYLILASAWAGFRFLRRPPGYLGISDDAIILKFRQGEVRTIGWNERNLILVFWHVSRGYSTAGPVTLRIDHSGGDVGRPWRSVAPIVPLSMGAFEMVDSYARSHGFFSSVVIAGQPRPDSFTLRSPVT